MWLPSFDESCYYLGCDGEERDEEGGQDAIAGTRQGEAARRLLLVHPQVEAAHDGPAAGNSRQTGLLSQQKVGQQHVKNGCQAPVNVLVRYSYETNWTESTKNIYARVGKSHSICNNLTKWKLEKT